jgi:hypothetical protein
MGNSDLRSKIAEIIAAMDEIAVETTKKIDEQTEPEFAVFYTGCKLGFETCRDLLVATLAEVLAAQIKTTWQ